MIGLYLIRVTSYTFFSVLGICMISIVLGFGEALIVDDILIKSFLLSIVFAGLLFNRNIDMSNKF